MSIAYYALPGRGKVLAYTQHSEREITRNDPPYHPWYQTMGSTIEDIPLKGTYRIPSVKSTPSHMTEISFTCSLVIN